jgi:hypothetical protein
VDTATGDTATGDTAIGDTAIGDTATPRADTARDAASGVRRPHRGFAWWARQRWIAAAAGAVVGALVFAVSQASMVDDAFITLTYARNLGLHGEWGMIQGLGSNTATSPLNVLLLGAGTAIVRDAIAATGLLLTLTFAVAGWWLVRIGDRLGTPPWRTPALGLAFLATSPLLLSTVGLESYLAATLMLGAVCYSLERRPWLVGIVAGLLVLARPDLVVFGGVAVLTAGRHWWRAGLAAAATTLPWFAWSWWNLGSAIPDTILLKVGTPWGPWSFWNGPQLWFENFPADVVLAAVPAAVGLLCLPLWVRPRIWPVGAILGAGALAHAAVFAVITTGPYHWYYAPAVSGLGLLAMITVARATGRLAAVPLVAATALLVVCAAAVLDDGLPRERAPIASNWASTAQYRHIATQLPRGAKIASPGEIGTLAYYCDCQVLDGFADRGLLRPLLEQRIANAKPINATLLRWNYARFDPGPPQRLDYAMQVWAVPPEGAPMAASFGYGLGWAIVPVQPGG